MLPDHLEEHKKALDNKRALRQQGQLVAGEGRVNICISVFPRFTACFSGIIPRFVSRSVGFGIVRIGFEL